MYDRFKSVTKLIIKELNKFMENVIFNGYDGKQYKARIVKRKRSITQIEYTVTIKEGGAYRLAICTAYLNREAFAARVTVEN